MIVNALCLASATCSQSVKCKHNKAPYYDNIFKVSAVSGRSANRTATQSAQSNFTFALEHILHVLLLLLFCRRGDYSGSRWAQHARLIKFNSAKHFNRTHYASVTQSPVSEQTPHPPQSPRRLILGSIGAQEERVRHHRVRTFTWRSNFIRFLVGELCATRQPGKKWAPSGWRR